ncbi:DUF4179 domain-containing protein [Mesobacillus zeae]|uniref:DUF4179 domain-containing protein n=1 Tax=Mesobacillus zeae TaxID=1917180 RepID=UPI00217547E2|nr:DUF4179 domain-containing protein [Mesobacillus zeae]
MGNKIKQELEKIEIPKELHERSITGIKQAKSEQPKGKIKRPLAVAAILFGLAGATAGFAFPTAASNLPLIGNIFKFLDEESGFYDNYKEYSTELNMTEESNGVKVTVNDAIFDGESVSVTYSIESKQDLGEEPVIFQNLDIKGSDGMTGSSQLKKIGENKYVGIMTGSNFSKDDPESVKVDWGIDGISVLNEGHESEKEIKGNWDFAFKVNATDSLKQTIGKSVKQDGLKVNIDKISMTPISFVLYYSQEVPKKIRDKWHDVSVDLEVKDDRGNIYSGEGNGGSGRNSYDMNWSKTFEKLDPEATKLIVTPKVLFRNSENFGSAEYKKDGTVKEGKLPKKFKPGNKEFSLEDIVIELEK